MNPRFGFAKHGGYLSRAYSDAMFNLARMLQRKNPYAEAIDFWRRARRSLKFCEIQDHLIAPA